MPRHLALAIALLLALGQTACLTFHGREPVIETPELRVFLRTDGTLTGTTPKYYEHPTTISNVRLVHVLSRIDIRTRVRDGNERLPAVQTEMLAPIAAGISEGLAKASPDQQVVVMATRTEHNFGIFDAPHLTSLVAYVRGDQLFLFVDRVDEPLDQRERTKPREPRVGELRGSFKIRGGEAMTVYDPQTVAVAWRDPLFRRPSRTKLLPSGEIKRKTILMESTPEVAEGPLEDALPGDLSPAQLRDLADLEEARQGGELTESQYRARKARILSPDATP